MKMLSLWSSANRRRYNSVRYYIMFFKHDIFFDAHDSPMKMLSLWSSANRRRYNSVRYYIMFFKHDIFFDAHDSPMKMLSLWSSANRRRYNSVRYYIIEVMDLQYILNFVFPFFKIFYKLVIAAGTSKRAKRTGKSTGGRRKISLAACWGFILFCQTITFSSFSLQP